MFLAEEGIDILNCNYRGVNALHLAISTKKFYLVKVLVSSDFPLECETKDGMSALQLAAFFGHLEPLKYIVEHLESTKPSQLKPIIDQMNPICNMTALSLAILKQN